MTELEKIAYAKSFLDKLAEGVNPLDGTTVPEGDMTITEMAYDLRRTEEGVRGRLSLLGLRRNDS